MSDSVLQDIEDLHNIAVQTNSNTYNDPATGFKVFTSAVHLRRGECCGFKCRHCPYGWENVAGGEEKSEKLCQSGNKKMAEELLSKMSISDTGKKKLHVPYTRTGDKGTSQLLGGERRDKDDAVFEAMGTVDELCSVAGTVHAELIFNKDDDESRGILTEWLLDVMSRLFDIGSHLANTKKTSFFPDTHIQNLEGRIDFMTETLPDLTSFILPTGSKASAQLHIARTVCRRAERRVLTVVRDHEEDENECSYHNQMMYLNRLSDFFFVSARFINASHGIDEIMYKKTKGADQRGRITLKNTDGVEDEKS